MMAVNNCLIRPYFSGLKNDLNGSRFPGICAESKWTLGMQQQWLFGNSSVTADEEGGT